MYNKKNQEIVHLYTMYVSQLEYSDTKMNVFANPSNFTFHTSC